MMMNGDAEDYDCIKVFEQDFMLPTKDTTTIRVGPWKECSYSNNLKWAGRKVGNWPAGGKKYGTGLNRWWHMGPRTVGWDGGTRLALWMIKRVTMNDNIQNLRYSTDSCQMEANDEFGRTKYNMFGSGHKEGGVIRLNCSGGGEGRREDYLGHCKWARFPGLINNHMTVYGCVGICNTHALLGILLTALQRRPPQPPHLDPNFGISPTQDQ